MKYAAAVLCLLMMSCKDPAPADIPPLEFYPLQADFQAGLVNDTVVVRIDGAIVSAARHTSDAALGRADSISLNMQVGRHTIIVLGPELKSKIDTAFEQQKARTYVGIGYDKSRQQWIYRYSQQPFVYVPIN
jgi:hypothetical protein